MPDRVPIDYETPPPKPAIPPYRKILAGSIILGGVVYLIAGLFAPTPAVRIDIIFMAGLIIVVGLVVLFQHVRLW